MDEAIQNGNRDLWLLAKLKNKTQCVPTCIDNCTDPSDISQLFADKYKSLYNAISYERNDIDNIFYSVETKIKHELISQGTLFNMDHLVKAIKV